MSAAPILHHGLALAMLAFHSSFSSILFQLSIPAEQSPVSDHPTDPGIYVLYDISQRPIYVGQGKNVKKRMKAHAKTKWFIPEIVDSASWIRVEDCDLRKQIEELLIRFLKSNAIINKQHVERQRTRANRAPNGGSKRRYISAKDAAISALKKGPLDIAALYESLSSQGVRSKDERSLRATLNQNDCFECRDGKWRLRKP